MHNNRSSRDVFTLLLAFYCSASYATDFSGIPITGRVPHVVVSATDQRALDVSDVYAMAHDRLVGQPLPEATVDWVVGVLDSAQPAHVFNYVDATAIGIAGPLVSGSEWPRAAPAEPYRTTLPLGVFAHGVQWLGPSGAFDSSAAYGQGNVTVLADSEQNQLDGYGGATTLGAPWFAFFTTQVVNSETHTVMGNDAMLRLPAVNLFGNPLDPNLPPYPYHIPLELVPAGDGVVAYFALPDYSSGGYLTLFPSLVGQLSGAVFRTAAPGLTVTSSGAVAGTSLLVATGSAYSSISEAVAADLGLNLAAPDFEQTVFVDGQQRTLPGFVLDSLNIPDGADTLTWSDLPVLIENVLQPDGTIAGGVLGGNLLGRHDYLFNGAASSPYLALSAAIVPLPPAGWLFAAGLVVIVLDRHRRTESLIC